MKLLNLKISLNKILYYNIQYTIFNIQLNITNSISLLFP